MVREMVPRVGVVFRPQLPPEQLPEFVAAAETGGLDDLWLWEDCFLEGGLTTATAALAWSRSLRIGLGLMPVPLRNPALAAMEIATVGRLFPGRFAPAVGHGVLDWMDQVGARVGSPMTLLREWTTAVRTLLRGEPVTASGRYVNLDAVALDWPPHEIPPLLVGARGPRTLALAGELGDGTVLDSSNSPDDVRTAIEHIAPPDGHDVVVYVYAGSDDAARDRIAQELPQIPDDAVAVGGPMEVAQALRQYADAGATTVVLVHAAREPDVPGFIRLASDARAELLGRVGR